MLCRLLVAFPPSQRSFPLACESARRLSSVAYTREEHELHMRTALQQAGKAFSEGEVPIGAVLIIDQTVVAEAHNRVEGHCDASAHAEILCMRSAGDKVGSWRMRNAVSLAKRIRTPNVLLSPVLLASTDTVLHCRTLSDVCRRHPSFSYRARGVRSE